MSRSRRRLTDDDYARLLTVRTALRRFERWSADQAAGHGLTASQHQLLLAVRGHPEPQGPTVRQVADYLLIKHHSAVELIDRAVTGGLVARTPDAADHRAVRLRLTRAGSRVVEELAGAHLDELAELTPLLTSLIGTLARS
jgi:DNA-binding MarR family transcriptional regulator